MNYIQLFCMWFLKFIKVALLSSFVFQRECIPSKFIFACILEVVSFCSIIFLSFSYEGYVRNKVQKLTEAVVYDTYSLSLSTGSGTVSERLFLIDLK